jgi:O-antigen/teichoic acid export membrane protein
MSDSPYKKLASNTLVFTIASFGSKVISFVMVPIYSYLLTEEEYGTVDLVLTTSSLLIPVLFLCISDAVLRYVMDKNYDKKSVVSNSLLVFLGGVVLFICVIPIIGVFFPNLKRFFIFLALVLFTNELSTLFNSLLRALGKVKLFAINGILHTLSFVGFNILFLVGFRFKIDGYLLSHILSSTISLCFAFVFCSAWNYIGLCIDKKILKKLLLYSVPLIPNALMWWIMDLSDKYIIIFYMDIAANGIYAMAKKLPSIIDMFNGFFNQAWRLSAIEENNSANIKGFTSKIYEMYSLLHAVIIGILLIVSRPFVMILAKSYKDTWEYIPLLLLSVSVSSLSAFLGSKFVANEKTKIIFRTTIIGAIVNTILNFLLIPQFGLNGAGFATFIGFSIVLFLRERRLIKDNELDIKFKRLPIYGLIIIEFVFYYIFPVFWSSLLNTFVLILFVIYKRSILLSVIQKFSTFVKKKSRNEVAK